ncbi:protein of unknown function [Lachnospiraceae bacterium C7]|nr:protein of unknown function [Lachnospiraceae bacterium C7]
MLDNEKDLTFENLTTAEQERMKRLCRKLLKTTFIVRDKDEIDRKDFFFCKKHENIIRNSLAYLGYDIILDQEAGVIRLVCTDNVYANRYQLNKMTSIVLCALWQLYASRIRKGQVDKYIIIQFSDLLNELEKYGVRDKFNKSAMKPILRELESFHLISVQGDIEEEECKVILYSSMQFCLDAVDFESFVKSSKKLLQTELQRKLDGKLEDEESEDFDSDEELEEENSEEFDSDDELEEENSEEFDSDEELEEKNKKGDDLDEYL